MRSLSSSFTEGQKKLWKSRHSERYDGLETLGAGQIGRQPDLFQRFEDGLAVVERLSPPLPGFGRGESLKAIELPDGMLAMAPRGGAVLIEDEALLLPGGVLVSTVDDFEVLPFGSRTHRHGSWRRSLSR